MKPVSEYNWCFACGKDNPIGLHLQFTIDEKAKTCVTHFTPKHEHQSYDGRMHGGLITVLLDEVMGTYLYRTEGVPAYTARMELRFRRPVFVGRPLTCQGHEVSRRGRLVLMEAQVLDDTGKVCVEASAKMMFGE